MTVRRGLPFVLALVLGMSIAVLAACGGGSTKSGVPSASAGELKSQITDVGQAVDDGRCDEVPGQLKQVDEGIDELPETTDRELVSALREGAEHLRSVATEECEEAETTTTETTPQETTTEPPPEEEPTEPEPTETTQTPPPTAPPPPPPPTGGTPAEPPAPPPVDPNPQPQPPPVSPGGGVMPEIPPDNG